MRLLKLVLATSVAATGLLVAPAAAPTSAGAEQGNGGHPDCVDHDSIAPGGTTPVPGEVRIKVGSDGDQHGHCSIGVKEAGFVIPDKFDVPGDKEKDVSHADVWKQPPPPPPPETVTPVESAPPSPSAPGSPSSEPESVESAPPSPPATGSASPDPELVELPKTGTTSTLVMAGIAALLVLSGCALLRLQSRPRRVRN